MIRTSLNVDYDLILELGRQAKMEKISRNALITKILLFAYDNLKDQFIVSRPVAYQNKEGKYKNINIYLRNEEYEIILDLRKFSKRSISLIFKEAFFLLKKSKTTKEKLSGISIYGIHRNEKNREEVEIKLIYLFEYG